MEINSFVFITNVVNNAPQLLTNNLKWCYIDEKKLPFTKDGNIARSNSERDFCDFNELINDNWLSFKGIAISVNFSNIVAIDIDKCIEKPFDLSTINEKAHKILSQFKDYYCEFSFSGTGLRILFKSSLNFDFKEKYYIKNSKENIEVYFPQNSYRYVSVTGVSIFKKNEIKEVDEGIITNFLETYMKRSQKDRISIVEEFIDEKEIQKRLKKLFINNYNFLEVWTSKAPGSRKNESELDYYLIKIILENITTNIDQVKQVFESSDYYLSKDQKHKNKWNRDNYEYFYTTIKSMIRR